MANKITKRTNIEEMLNDDYIKNHENWCAYLQNEKDLLDSKNANRKPTKTQTENVALSGKVQELLDSGFKGTATEIAKAIDDSYTSQKLTPILTKLVESGTIEKVKGGKGRTYVYSTTVATEE